MQTSPSSLTVQERAKNDNSRSWCLSLEYSGTISVSEKKAIFQKIAIYCNKVHIPSKLKYWTIRQCVFSGEHSLGSLGLSIQFKSSIKLHWWHFKLCDVSEMRNQIEFEIIST